MNVLVPILSGIAGAVAGWLVFRIVDWTTVGEVREAQARERAPLQQWLTILTAALLIAAVSVKFGAPSVLLFVYGALILVLLGVTLFDLRKHEIPHIVTLPGIIVGLLIGTFVLPLGFVGSAAGLVLGGGVLLAATIVETIRKKEIGGGDWKYAAMIGSFIGPQKIIVALVLTGVIGFVGAVVLAISGSVGRPQALGPWLSAGAVASILLG